MEHAQNNLGNVRAWRNNTGVLLHFRLIIYKMEKVLWTWKCVSRFSVQVCWKHFSPRKRKHLARYAGNARRNARTSVFMSIVRLLLSDFSRNCNVWTIQNFSNNILAYIELTDERRSDEATKIFFCDFLLRNCKWWRRGFSLVQATSVTLVQTEQSKQKPYYSHTASRFRRSVGTTGHCLTPRNVTETRGTHLHISEKRWSGFSGAGKLTGLETVKECKIFVGEPFRMRRCVIFKRKSTFTAQR
jgi:hypothetical protein